MASLKLVRKKLGGFMRAGLGPSAVAAVLAQTDMNSAMSSTVSIVSAVIPLMVMVLVLKLLFSSFKEIGKG